MEKKDRPVINPARGRAARPLTVPMAARTLPPLPDPIPDPVGPVSPEAIEPRPTLPPERVIRPFQIRSLREGCYLLKYTPQHSWGGVIHYDGTLRVERAGTNTIASGDLYQHPVRFFPFPPSSIGPEPEPTRIPIFPRNRYRYYMRVTQILEWFTFASSFTLGFELHRFQNNAWTLESTLTARMSWTTPPADWPTGVDYLTGNVKTVSGAVVGHLTMGWVSPSLRRAVFEIDRVQQSELPEDNGDGDGWRDLFAAAGWNVTVVESDVSLREPSGESWSNIELHQKMLDKRDASDLDAEWRYHLLCVRQLDATSRGIMYDAYGGDSNNIPREGAAIASHWIVPNQPKWGTVQGARFGETVAYFRTAVHELGHALGLYHNTADNGFMNTTGVIAGNPGVFPQNITWAFNPDDAKRLRHMPDAWVRPGMVPFGQSYNTAPISPDDMFGELEELELHVTPVVDCVPIGAPVRLNIELFNRSDREIPVPASLSLKSGHVKGQVLDATGMTRDFWPMIRCLDDDETVMLAPGKSISHAMTLLRGPHGALFANSGVHTVVTRVEWELDGFRLGVTGQTEVWVTPAVDEEHARAAQRILSTPDTLLVLVLGGDHLTEGVQAIQDAMENPTLRPHFTYVEAKRISKAFMDRKADPKRAVDLLDKETVLSATELRHIAGWIRAIKQVPDEALGHVARFLHDKAEQIEVDEDTKHEVEAVEEMVPHS